METTGYPINKTIECFIFHGNLSLNVNLSLISIKLSSLLPREELGTSISHLFKHMRSF